MRALVLNAHGGPETLTYETAYPDPEPGEGQVLIKVGACSLNYHDVFTRRGMPGIKVPLPVVPGLDIAGEVAALGPGVTGVAVGERVLVDPVVPGVGLIGEMCDGGLAEYCVASGRASCARSPTAFRSPRPRRLPVAYGTAHRMLTTNGPIEPGQTVLVLGASGGVGTACVMLAKLAGAEVIAAASSEEKLARLKELGADHLINYTKTDFTREIMPSATAGRSAGPMTAASTWSSITPAATPGSRRCGSLKRGGRLMVCGATAGFDPTEDLALRVELRVEDPRFEPLA